MPLQALQVLYLVPGMVSIVCFSSGRIFATPGQARNTKKYTQIAREKITNLPFSTRSYSSETGSTVLKKKQLFRVYFCVVRIFIRIFTLY